MANNIARKAAPNHDNEAGFIDFSTTALASKHIKPPKCPVGVQYPIYVVGADKHVKGKGDPFVVWEWEDLETDEYEAVLDAFGLTWAGSDLSNNCTVAVLTDRNANTYTNYNGVVTHIKAQDTIFVSNRFKSARFTIKLTGTT